VTVTLPVPVVETEFKLFVKPIPVRITESPEEILILP